MTCLSAPWVKHGPRESVPCVKPRTGVQGLMTDFSADRRTVELVPHDPSWVAQAAAESQRLAAAIDETLIRIEHIGSTSIPGIVAKPTIDLMPIVKGLAEL